MCKKTNLDSLLEQSHVISIHCNLTDETRHLINRMALKKMHQTPVVINTARGPVVNEADLLQALESNKIHSADLDVYQDEPPLEKTQNLLNHPHVIATGHYAWYSEKAGNELQKRAAKNMV